MSDIIKFYRGDKTDQGYTLDYLVNLEDADLEKLHDYIQWLFPDKSGGVTGIPKLTDEDIAIFLTDEEIRRNVVKVYLRMMLFFGFYISDQGIKKLKRDRNTGLYLPHNYNRISRMLNFLNVIDMNRLSTILLYCICIVMKEDKDIKKLIKLSDSKKFWKESYSHMYMFPLQYKNNSCYIDSSLVSLFLIPNDIIDNGILLKPVMDREDCPVKEVQKALLDITLSIRGERDVDYCTDLRKVFKKCPSQTFYTTEMGDVAEFVSYIFTLFNFDIMTIREQNFYSRRSDKELKKGVKTVDRTFKTIPILKIDAYFEESKKIDLEDFIFHKTDTILESGYVYNGKKYRRQVSIKTVVDSPYLIFHVNRVFLDKVIEKPVIYEEYINNLRLSSVIVHRSQHYTCFFRHGDNWYYYNDMSGVKYVGSYEDINDNTFIMKRGVLFFYT